MSTFRELSTVIPVNWGWLKKYINNIWIAWHTSWVLLASRFFYQKSTNFAVSENTDTDSILVHNL